MPTNVFENTISRRLLTIPAYTVAAASFLLVLPLLLLVAFAADVVRPRRFVLVRTVAMVVVYLFAEIAGIAASGHLWLRYRLGGQTREQFLDANFRLQCWWAGTLYDAGVRLFSLRPRIEGAHEAAAGPVLIFARHVSILDNLLPAALLSRDRGLRLRWVINRSLLRDPCLDIVGHRLPNAFVRGGDDEGKEITAVANLARNLAPDEGVLIFPEGALFNARRLERLRNSPNAQLASQAARFNNVLPPRAGGALALLEANEDADIVFCAHSGLESALSYRAFLSGRLIGSHLTVEFWRVPRSIVPTTRDERLTWLADQWERIDRFVGQSARSPVPPPNLTLGVPS